MRLELTGRHLDITPAIRRLVDGKLSRLERMLNGSALSAQVVIAKEKNGYRADVTLHARGEKFLHGVGKGTALQGCLGAAFDKVSQQAQKVKGKWQERKRRGPGKGRSADGPEASVAPRTGARTPVATPPAGLERARMPQIFRASRQRLTAMSVGDAARQIDGSDGVVVFRDAETSAVSVLYRAPSGELTLVQTDT
jgi:putative sigma-54 modulation protein